MYQRDDAFVGVFQHVVAGVGEAVDLGGGEKFDPAVEEVDIEDEILHAPADEHGELLELSEIFFGVGDDIPGAVAGGEGDVLDEAVDGEAVVPGVVEGEIGAGDIFREGAGDAIFDCAAGEGIEAADEEAAEERGAGEGKLPGHFFGFGEGEAAGVEDDEFGDALGVAGGVGHADHAAPIVQDECEGAAEV